MIWKRENKNVGVLYLGGVIIQKVVNKEVSKYFYFHGDKVKLSLLKLDILFLFKLDLLYFLRFTDVPL